MDRRTACASLAALAAGHLAVARAQAPRVARVAWVGLDPPNPNAASLVNFRRGMRDHGWVEGRNLDLTIWWGDGKADRLTEQIPAILASRPDVVVAGQVSVGRLAHTAIKQPIVFSTSGDPVAGGFVASYARPGGNLTGISFFMTELVGKRIETLREILPSVTRIAFVGWSRHAGEPLEVKDSLEAARKLGVEAIYRPANSTADIDAAYEEFAKWRADAIIAFADGITLPNASRMAAHSRRLKIPTISGWAEFALAGNLFSYGPNREEAFARLASFVDRILKGAKPGDLPVERPAKLEFVINQQAARELGIRIPPSVLARAHQFID
ncbi:MAG: ABC transporter substrate-binding protein [Vicinamibacteria bacterium]|jgi:putative ABC transport system substrate-binding protein